MADDPLIFPLQIPGRVLLLGRPGLAFTIDLPCFDEELWLPLAADGKHEKGVADPVGYLLLRKRITLQPGLTTYAVVEARPPHDPPPNPASWKTVFQWPELGVSLGLMRSGSARHG